MQTSATPFHDLAAFTALARVDSLALSQDGSRLVAAVSQIDRKRARYVSSLWEIDPTGEREPSRLTWSEKGESSPAFLLDGSLLFLSGRPERRGAEEEDDDVALWRLPPLGEAQVLARYPGGLRGPLAVAAGSGTVLVAAGRPVGADGDGAEQRKLRRDRKVTGILHTGMPIRYWDHELGATSPRLLCLPGGTGEPVDLVPDAVFELEEAACTLSDDGATIVTTWRQRRRGGRTQLSLAVLDGAGGPPRLITDKEGADLEGPRLSPDGRLLAAFRGDDGDFTRTLTHELVLYDLASPEPVPQTVELGDLWATETAWAPDGATVYVAGDLHGRGAVVAVDAASAAVTATLADDAAYATLLPAPDGAGLFCLRSAVDAPAAPVRLATSPGAAPRPLPSPAGQPPIPGRLEELSVEAGDGATLRAWLCLPEATSEPAPLMLWVHGGPFASWNSWSWRWNPWVAVARGYAVLLPDPALSTGYGSGWMARAWPHRAGLVWADLEAVLDAALARPDLDGEATACLGGSFGGYMTNWIAGHTDRFGAIVTHAGLWALDQQHATTDAAEWKTGLFGTPTDHPEWYAENSPNRFVERIRTPMLVIHGNRDYRVPVSEALRLWWDLVSRFDGEPEDLPHRFLQFTSENHWVLSPANAEVWYETVLAFCDQHVRGLEPQRSSLL